MEKDFDFVQKGYTADAVIARGYAIYDAWLAQRLSSRRIVSRVMRAAAALGPKGAKMATLEALSYLFALDLRIEERYKSLWHCIFRYFSWRRETNAQNKLKGLLRLSKSGDIRTAIEVALQILREELSEEDSEDTDDETRGGKRNGKAEEESTRAEEKGEEQAPEEMTEEIDEAQESKEAEDGIEEKTEDNSKQTEEKTVEKETEIQESAELLQDAPEDGVQAKTEPKKQEKATEYKEENNGPAEEAEPRNDKTKEAKAYNDAVDSPPPSEVQKSDKRAAKPTSFIDEVILDNMVKGKADFIHHNPLDDLKANGDVPVSQSQEAKNAQEGKSNDRDAYLYDKTVTNEKDVAKENLNETVKETNEAKPEATKESETSPAVKQEEEDLRVPLQVDITESQENEMRKELAYNMSLETIQAIIDAKKEAAREQMRIAELEMDAPTEIAKKAAPVQANPPSITTRKK